MQYVGRFMSSVYNTITPNINAATLSGAIDVIVVERQVEREVDDDDDDEEGAAKDAFGGQKREKKKKKILVTELASTPFHVRFGKMSVLRPAERKVTLHLNNSPDPLPFTMKVGEAGEAELAMDAAEASAASGSAASGTATPDESGGGAAQPPVPPPPRRAQSEPTQGGEPDVEARKTYAKTLRLTSDQLKSLNLRKGANTITFSVTSSYSGVATCAARIFLWDGTHRIVVSDIDGTITKSDALGHVYAMIGRDWTHRGVAKLYTDIARNGYRIMYLTSRAIGQADMTRDYLRSIKQDNYRLPDGPVIMSPDRLMASLHREVILRKPEVFKMACLRDIARLFGADPRTAAAQPGSLLPDLPKETLLTAETLTTVNRPGIGEEGSADELSERNSGIDLQAAAAAVAATEASSGVPSVGGQPTPFYAGFGNRITDALSYRSVSIPSSRIFTIDHNGEVKMELLELAGYKSSYIHMTDLVDQMFPPITARTEKGAAGKPEFNDFNYWRPEIGEFDLPSDDELVRTPLASSPVSPALSARSVRSDKSARSAASTTRLREDGTRAGGGGELSSLYSNGGAKSMDDDGSGVAATTSRLSRFGLGKLGLSRKGSTQTIAGLPSGSGTWPDFGGQQSHESSNSEPPTLPASPSSASMLAGTSPPSSPGSYASSVSSWTTGWRRRAASPGAQSGTGGVQATSPLVGPVITAEPDDEEGEDDDVSSFGGDDVEEEDEDEEDEEEDANDDGVDDDRERSERVAANRRRRQAREEQNMGDDVLDNDDDPLLATGEIQFEWRG